LYNVVVRIFKRETSVYWVDIYFFGSKAADSFNPADVSGVLRWSRIGPSQVQVLTTNHRSIESAAKLHESQQLDLMRSERQEYLSTLGAAAADAISSPGGIEGQFSAANVQRDIKQPKKKGGCRGCGKKKA